MCSHDPYGPPVRKLPVHQHQPERLSFSSPQTVEYSSHSVHHTHQRLNEWDVRVCVIFPAAQEILSYPGNIKTFLEFMLKVLPVSGDSFLPVFRCVHGFCVGEWFLAPSDEALLMGQMKLDVAVEDKGGGGGEKSVEENKGKEGNIEDEEQKREIFQT